MMRDIVDKDALTSLVTFSPNLQHMMPERVCVGWTTSEQPRVILLWLHDVQDTTSCNQQLTPKVTCIT